MRRLPLVLALLLAGCTTTAGLINWRWVDMRFLRSRYSDDGADVRAA